MSTSSMENEGFMQGIEYGKPTERERELMHELGHFLANLIEKSKIERSELICAFSLICHLIFSVDTPIKDVDQQIQEIESFCHFLKIRALEYTKNG